MNWNFLRKLISRQLRNDELPEMTACLFHSAGWALAMMLFTYTVLFESMVDANLTMKQAYMEAFGARVSVFFGAGMVVMMAFDYKRLSTSKNDRDLLSTLLIWGLFVIVALSLLMMHADGLTDHYNEIVDFKMENWLLASWIPYVLLISFGFALLKIKYKTSMAIRRHASAVNKEN